MVFQMLELEKKQIHMSRSREPVTIQITLDQDFNVPDSRPDVGGIILKQAEVQTDELRQSGDRIFVRGSLEFELLYLVDQSKEFQNLGGTLEFEDTIGYPELEQQDYLRCRARVEDLSVRVIHSRKLHISAVLGLTFSASADCTVQETCGIRGNDSLETLKTEQDILSLQIQKKDTFRIREEIALSQGKPPADSLLWKSLELRSLEYRPLDAAVSVRAEALIFAVYRSGRDMPLQWLEKPVTFQSDIPVAGCNPSMIPSIEARLLHREIEPKEDGDGENRILAVDAVIELDMKFYSEEKAALLCDVYCPGKRIETKCSSVTLERLLVKNSAKCRVTESISLHPKDTMLQICHSQGKVIVDRTEVVENGILAEGAVQVTVLYLAANDERPLQSASGAVPFSHVIAAEGIASDHYFDVSSMLEQLNVMIAAGGEAEVRAVISFDTLAMARIPLTMIEEAYESDAEDTVTDGYCRMVGYCVQKSDTLWKIAKKYGMSGKKILEMNEIKEEEILSGKKLLLVR